MRILLLLSFLLVLSAQKAFAAADTVATAPIQLALVAPHHYLRADEYMPDKARRHTPLSQLTEQQYANRLMLRGGVLVVAAGSMAFIGRKYFDNSGGQNGGQTFGAIAGGGTVLLAGVYGLFLLISGAYYDGQLHGSRTLNWTP